MLRLFVDGTRDGSRPSDVDERPRGNVRRSKFLEVHHDESLSFSVSSAPYSSDLRPFEWNFTRDELAKLIDRLAAHEPQLRLAS